MDIIRRIGKHFSDSANLKSRAFDLIAPEIVKAAELMSCAIINNHKIVAFSNPTCLFSGYFVSKMAAGLEVNRPSFPAMELIPNLSSIVPMMRNQGCGSVLSRQLSIFGQPNDVLLAITPGGDVESFPELLSTARDREVAVVALTANNVLSPFLEDSDVCIDISSGSRVRAEEIQLLILNCICDALDCLLLGLEDV